MPLIRTVTVYCSSSNDLHADHFVTAHRVGELLALSGRNLVFGGGRVGLMGEIARACRENGGQAFGIITERLKMAEQMDPDNHENIVVKTMRERKALLEARGDAIVVLPGGLGTLEEFFEILVGRLLGEHDKPIFILNPPDPDSPRARAPDAPRFFDPLLEMIEHMIRSRFARPGVRGLFQVVTTPEEVIAALNSYGLDEVPVNQGSRDDLLPTSPGGIRHQPSSRG